MHSARIVRPTFFFEYIFPDREGKLSTYVLRLDENANLSFAAISNVNFTALLAQNEKEKMIGGKKCA